MIHFTFFFSFFMPNSIAVKVIVVDPSCGNYFTLLTVERDQAGILYDIDSDRCLIPGLAEIEDVRILVNQDLEDDNGEITDEKVNKRINDLKLQYQTEVIYYFENKVPPPRVTTKHTFTGFDEFSLPSP